jgi:hypothetical protein
MSTCKTHLERALSILPLPYYWAAAALGAFFFLISIAIMALLEGSFAHIIMYFLLSTLIALQIVFVYWAHEKITNLRSIFIDIIELPEPEVIAWHKGQEEFIFNDARMALGGVVITIIAVTLGLDNFGLVSQPYLTHVFVQVYYYLAHYIMGAGLYVMLATALMVYDLAGLPLRIDILISKNILLKGILYSKFTICAASVYIVWGLFHLSTPQKLSSLASIIWFSSFAIILCAYFLIPQYSIHKLIARTKKRKLEAFSAYLREKTEDALRHPTKENADILKVMLDIQCLMDEMYERPFGSNEVLHIVLIVIIPIIVVLLEIMFGIIK